MGKYSRTVSPGGFYHIYNRGVEKTDIFLTPKEKQFFVRCMREAKDKYQAEIYAYCIMNNHFHLLLRGELDEISYFMMDVQGRYGQTYNNCHHHTGHVFQNIYRSKAICTEDYFWGVLRYIHMNPVKAGIATYTTEYAYSSISQYYAFKESKSIISKNASQQIHNHFTFHNFIQFHQCTDHFIYDDTEEEKARQIKDLENEALELFRNKLSIASWDEARSQLFCLDDMIELLISEFPFSYAHISKLLGTSRYRVDRVKNIREKKQQTALRDIMF